MASAADLALFGLSPDDVDELVELWGINRESFEVFNSLSTQWRTGMNGATGLDYAAIPVVMSLMDLDLAAERRQGLFHDIRIMERAALDAMAGAREE